MTYLYLINEVLVFGNAAVNSNQNALVSVIHQANGVPFCTSAFCALVTQEYHNHKIAENVTWL